VNIIEDEYLATGNLQHTFEGEYLFTGKPKHQSGVVYPQLAAKISFRLQLKINCG